MVKGVPPSTPSPVPAGWDAFAATHANDPSVATANVMFKVFADFTGRLLQDYHRASNHVTATITRLEQEWQHDRDTIVSTKTTMDELREIVVETTKANVKAISDLLTAINMVCLDTTTAVNDARSDTNKIITQFSQTIGSVRTTTEDAKGLATNAQILTGNAQEKVTLFANAVDRHDTQLGKLRELGASVAKLGQEVVELRASIQGYPPALDAGVWDTAKASAQAVEDSPLDRDKGIWTMGSTSTQVTDDSTGAQRKSPPESIDFPGLGLDVSPHANRSTAPTEDADRIAETAPVHQPQAHPCSPTHSNIDGTHTRPGFPTWHPPNFRARDDWYPPSNRVQHINPRDDRYPCNHPPPHYQSQRPYPLGAMDRTVAYDIPTMGGTIVSPRASDQKRIAWERKTSRYSIVNLATPHYHGGDKGVMVLMEKFICDCGYNSFSPESTEEVLFCYNDIMMVH